MFKVRGIRMDKLEKLEFFPAIGAIATVVGVFLALLFREIGYRKISLFCCVLMVGCAAPKKDSRSFFLEKPLKIVVVDESTLETIGIENFEFPLRGFYFPAVRIIMVRYSDDKDKDGNYLPDFEALGHEFYHALAGNFHSK